MPKRLDTITDQEIDTFVRAAVAEPGWYTPGLEIDLDQLRAHVKAAMTAAVLAERSRNRAALARGAAALERAAYGLRELIAD